MSHLGGPLDTSGMLAVGPLGGPLRARGRPRTALRSTAVALLSTVVVFGILVWITVNAPGWAEVQVSFFNATVFTNAFPDIVAAFWLNIQLFAIAEVLILVLALVLAVFRSLPGPVFFPLRLLATIYADIFRAVPGVLVIYILGFGIPGLGLPGIPTDPFPYAVIALTLIYSAYVSEVYRAGIESVHPSQEAAARSLGLSRLQALRYVILPQAVRRVIPPLLNDFIGLQKDTVLVSYIGVVEIFRQSQITQQAKFNYTPYMATALVFIAVTLHEHVRQASEWNRDRDEDERRGHVRRVVELRLLRDLRLAEDLHHPDVRDEDRVLLEADEIIEERRDDAPDRLREDHVPKRLEPGEPERPRGGFLAGVDRLDPGTVDLRDVRRVDQRQGDHRVGEWVGGDAR